MKKRKEAGGGIELEEEKNKNKNIKGTGGGVSKRKCANATMANVTTIRQQSGIQTTKHITQNTYFVLGRIRNGADLRGRANRRVNDSNEREEGTKCHRCAARDTRRSTRGAIRRGLV